MIRIKAHNSQAFASGFIDGFGNVGQVFEPAVDGISVIKEVREPVRIQSHKAKGKINFYTRDSKDGRYMITGVCRERRRNPER